MQVIICISINVIYPTRVFAKALGYCETPATSYALLEVSFVTKITERKLQFALSDGILGGNHYFLFPYKKAHSVWEYDLYYLGSFMCFFIIISSSYGIQ